MEDEKRNVHFLSLILSLSSTCMQQLGKVTNPITGKIEKNLHQAKTTIEMMEMIKEKTKNNLTKDEESIFNSSLSSLQLNYADEVEKEEKEKKEEESEN